MAISVQYASKLFLDRCGYANNALSHMLRPGAAPILALLGDIISPFSKHAGEFIKWTAANWEHTMWVPGYHECCAGAHNYGKTIEECTLQMKNITKSYSNVHIMNNGIFEYDGIRFLGSSLWDKHGTYTGIHHYPYGHTLPKAMIDHDFDEVVARNIRWFDNHIDEAWEDKTAITCLSYTVPFYYCMGSDDNRVHNNDLTDVLRPNVRCWLAGDTNACTSGIMYDTFVGTNSAGKADNGYIPNMITRVKY